MVKRLHNYPDSARLTEDQCAELAGVKKSTIARHRAAGLIPYTPTRPITITAGDLRIYLKMVSNGVSRNLHRTMRIQSEDCPPYSRLDGMQSLTYANPDAVIGVVVKQTHQLWLKYRDADHAKVKK